MSWWTHNKAVHQNSPSDFGEVYLTTVSTELEATMLQQMLEAESIPVLLKYKENGACLRIYMGASNFGVELYVPEPALEQARSIAGIFGEQ